MSNKTVNETNEEYRSWAINLYKEFSKNNRMKCLCGVDHYFDEDVNLHANASKQQPIETQNSNVPRS